MSRDDHGESDQTFTPPTGFKFGYLCFVLFVYLVLNLHPKTSIRSVAELECSDNWSLHFAASKVVEAVYS
jgi:hypothetical protein